MPQINGLSLNGAQIISTANQARMANSVCRLFKQGFYPAPTSTLADFAAHEADFAGYAPQTMAAWQAPVLFGQGWATYAPTQTFRWTAGGDNLGNMIAGAFTVTAGGQLVDYIIFDQAVSVTGPGQAVIVTPLEITPAG